MAQTISLVQQNRVTIESERLEINFYRGVEGLKHMLELSLKSKRELQGGNQCGTILKQTARTVFKKNFFIRRASAEITPRLIWPQSAPDTTNCSIALLIRNQAAYKIEI